MKVLTLDIATVTGWAAWRPEPGFESGVFRIDTSDLGTGEFGVRYSEWLRAKLADIQPDDVVFEAPILPRPSKKKPKASISIGTLRRLYGLVFVTEAVCREAGVAEGHIWEANQSTVVKHFTGHAGGKREERKARTIAACRELGWDPEDHNEADALAILSYALHCLRVDSGLPAGPLFGVVGEAA